MNQQDRSSIFTVCYTLSDAWSGVNWADLMAAQRAFGTDFYDRSTRTIVGTMLWTEYRPVIKIGPKGALGGYEIRPIHSASSLGQSIVGLHNGLLQWYELFTKSDSARKNLEWNCENWKPSPIERNRLPKLWRHLEEFVVFWLQNKKRHY